MKLTVTFNELVAQRERIGAALTGWDINSGTLDPRDEVLGLLVPGIVVRDGEIEIGPGGLLTYKGEQVLLYIKDTQSSLWTLQNEPEKSRRFHIAECQTLQKMRRDGRFERYVLTNRMDGQFLVDWLNQDNRKRGETEARLKVCKNCLGALNWRGYEKPQDRIRVADGTQQTKNSIWESFSVSEFLMEYSTFFHTRPSRRDTAASLNIYVKSWPKISEQKRRAAKWRCERCTVDLSSAAGLLHCHHKSGVVTDNSPSNLAVLCALCHSQQPGHKHMSVSAKERSRVEGLRIAQRTNSGRQHQTA